MLGGDRELRRATAAAMSEAAAIVRPEARGAIAFVPRHAPRRVLAAMLAELRARLA